MNLPAEEAQRWIVARYASLRAAHGAAFLEAPLVLPTSEFFPDPFELATLTPTGRAPSLDTLVARLLEYAPVQADVVAHAVVRASNAEGDSGCCGGGCSVPRAHAASENEDGDAGGVGSSLAVGAYGIEIDAGVLGNSALLVGALARGVGGIVLAEAGETVASSDAAAASHELAAVVSGFGLLLLNASSVYVKGCGGLRARRATTLDTPELALALALFVRLHAVAPRRARAHMAVTQREAFDEALRWADSNRVLLDTLASAPETLEGGAFSLSPTLGFLGRLFAGRAAAENAPPSATSITRFAPLPRSARPPRSAEEAARIAETRALVEDALRGS